jgi:hypothetical protein
MTIIHRCDRCGEDCKGSNCKTVKLADLGAGNVGAGGSIPAGGDDLCHDCVESLKRWLRERPAKAARSI